MPSRRLLLSCCLLAMTAGVIACPSAAPASGKAPEIAEAPAPLPLADGDDGSPEIVPPPPALPDVASEAATAPSSSDADTSILTDRLPLFGLMDREVVGSDKATIGHVIDLLLDAKGRPQAILVETGGFMGVGDRKIAVAWPSVGVDAGDPGGPIHAVMTTDEVRAAPEYQANGPVTVAVSGLAASVPAGPPPVADAPVPLLADGQEGDVPVASPPSPLASPHASRGR